MTLVELLVVIAILGLLAVAVIPSFSSTADRRQAREAARSASSYISRAQSRALGRSEWAGFAIVPATPAGSAALDLYLADVPAVFRGNSLPTLVTGSVRNVYFDLNGALDSPPRVVGAPGDLVRFDGKPPWYTLVSSTTVTQNKDNVAQSISTAAWPAAGIPHTFELHRQPVRSGSPFTLAGGRCIDLRWSGIGGNSLLTYQPFGAAPGVIAILFDGTGRLRQLVRGTGTEPLHSAVYLLVGRADRAGNDPAGALSPRDDTAGANWQYADSYWISIDPISGIVKTAECVASAADVYASQAFIRSESPTGG